MIKSILLFFSAFLLAGCGVTAKEAVPQDRITSDENKDSFVAFSFEETNRFSKSDFNLGIPKLQLMNETVDELETDFRLSVDYYDNGWQEIDTIDYYVKDYPYALYEEDHLTYSLFTDHFDSPLETGKYRLVIDYSLLDEEANEEEAFKIGTVFWIEE